MYHLIFWKCMWTSWAYPWIWIYICRTIWI